MEEWPDEVRNAVGGGTGMIVSGGESGAVVYRVGRSGARDSYLKVEAGEGRAELHREKEVLAWLSGRAGAPLVEGYWVRPDRAYLLMSAVPGRPAAELASRWEPETLLVELSRALRRLHSLPVATCPFHRTLSVVVAEAKRRAEEGLVDVEDLDEERRGWSARRLLEELDRTVPATEELVFTHGDFTLPNTFLHGGRVSGLIDWGRAGVADRYRDIALLLREFPGRTARPAEEVLRGAYGIPEIDRERVCFYQLLDEFF